MANGYDPDLSLLIQAHLEQDVVLARRSAVLADRISPSSTMSTTVMCMGLSDVSDHRWFRGRDRARLFLYHDGLILEMSPNLVAPGLVQLVCIRVEQVLKKLYGTGM